MALQNMLAPAKTELLHFKAPVRNSPAEEQSEIERHSMGKTLNCISSSPLCLKSEIERGLDL